MFRDEDLNLKPLVPLAESREGGEVARLRARLAAGEDRPEAWVVPAWVEEEFYRLNNLQFQIERLFAGVWGVRVDEERLARAAAEAARLVRTSYLVSERGEAFVAALPPGRFRLYRPGEVPQETAASPQEALWALKRLWAARWSLDAVMERGPGGWPEPAPVVVEAPCWGRPIQPP
ncbi:hypothetical protein [Oceanithermus desulfurans]|uniref:Uncharacterized protein n=2 Tax=Oceanithermus desulfurans TaxID=227924 RepID=A0A511RKC8_9DEIN|nr:hypothetical protein [Oceanithermus desulfurans]MBB6030486.1 hypothetical protein [Oceanithermus desulfurans]GEM90103.1 hypothetical protein ODE01S_15370 [Oceanithermus desulfurans NBRC 100063]